MYTYRFYRPIPNVNWFPFFFLAIVTHAQAVDTKPSFLLPRGLGTRPAVPMLSIAWHARFLYGHFQIHAWGSRWVGGYVMPSDVEQFRIITKLSWIYSYILLSYHLWLVHGYHVTCCLHCNKGHPLLTCPATWEFSGQSSKWEFTNADCSEAQTDRNDGLDARCITTCGRDHKYNCAQYLHMYTKDEPYLPIPLGGAGWLLALLQDTSSMHATTFPRSSTVAFAFWNSFILSALQLQNVATKSCESIFCTCKLRLFELFCARNSRSNSFSWQFFILSDGNWVKLMLIKVAFGEFAPLHLNYTILLHGCLLG